jgi:hypothetical protein
MRMLAHRWAPLALAATGLVVAWLAPAAPARADRITVDAATTVFFETANGDTVFLDTTSPFPGTQTAADAGVTSTGTYALGGDQLTFDFEQAREDGIAQSSGTVVFNVSTNSNFKLTGSYSAFDAFGADPALLGLSVVLDDLTAGETVFRTAGSLGGPEARITNLLQEGFVVVGSPFGTLLKDHTYQLEYSYTLDVAAEPETFVNNSSAVGQLQLTIVPVPAAVWGGMGLMSAIGSISAWRRRNSRRDVEL